MGNDYPLIKDVDSSCWKNGRFFRFLCGISVLLPVFMFFFCNDKEIQVEKLRIGKQIPEWTEKKGTYKVFDAQGLFDIINGGAPEYIDNGMIKGITQQIVISDSTTIELFAEDFGSPEKARAMYLVKKGGDQSDASDSSEFHGFMISKVIGGFWCCGSVGRFYFEITVSGVGDRGGVRGMLEELYRFYRGVSE